MEKGYIENGFIVDVTGAKKTSEIIYEVSRVLDMPESKEKHICLKLGSIDLNQNELTSIKTLVDVMNSQLAFISTSSAKTLDSATALNIRISEFTNQIEAPTFSNVDEQVEDTQFDKTQTNSAEFDEHLTNIFGETDTKESVETNKKNETEEKEITPVKRLDEVEAQLIEKEKNKKEKGEDIENLKAEAEKLPTLYLRKTIRSGQSISSDGNIIVIGDVNPGAEVIAKGDITVWGILGGIAHAGSDGNNYARIRALKLNPVQIRIGEIFARRPDTVNIPYVQKTSAYTPEEAFTFNGSIIIRKIHEEN